MPGQRASEDFRKTQIVDAAFMVAKKEGLNAVTGRAVAKEAKLSNGLVYFYFPTNEELLKALLDSLIAWLFEGDYPIDNLAEDEKPHKESMFLKLLKYETDIYEDEREKIILFMEYWVLGFRNPVFFKMLNDTIKNSREFIKKAIISDREAGLRFAKLADIDSLSALGVGIIMGSALQELLEPSWVKNNNLLKEFEKLLLK